MRRGRAILALLLASGLAAAVLGGGGAQTAVLSAAPGTGLAKATFAGGCFWCMEGPFDKLDGVVSTTSGYTGGSVVRPTYEAVSSGRTGHTEAVEVLYDPAKVGYDKLLYVFWRNVDPVDGRGQFCDKGTQYRPGIYFHDPEQRRLAEESLRELQGRFKDRIAVEVVPAGPFYAAEDYHQDYYQKNPARYRFYRFGCGRDGRLKSVWRKEAGGGDTDH